LDPSRALAISAHASLASEALLLFGTDVQKQTHLPALARGEAIGAFALTETGAGSDAGGIQTYAEHADGHWTLTGSKAWVTNGPVADKLIVFARTSQRDERVKPRITAFVVDRAAGVETGALDAKLGVRGAPSSEIRFDGVRLGENAVLGEVGRGFKVAMEVLNRGRVTLAAAALGQAKRLVRIAVERAHTRAAFGREIAQFALVKDKVARMMADVYAMESVVYLTTAFLDGAVRDPSIECAIVKVLASESLVRVAEESASIAGALGYSSGSPWERHLRDARVHLIFPGTNDILRCFVALSGMQGPGRELDEVSKAMREPIKGFGLLSDFAVRKARSALGRERMTKVHPSLQREALVLEEYTAELAKNVDKVLRKHGKDIAEMQFSQKRVADMAIDLYAVGAVVARTSRSLEKRGEEGARRELGLASVFVAAAERRLAENVAAFDRNDDDVRKAIADKAYVDGGYPFDLW
jgi:acyl-CoA dehydrogenase family protein 9